MQSKYVALCALIILTVVSSTIQGQDGKAVVAAAVQEMGAANLKTLVLTGAGTNAGVGQNVSPDRPWPLVQVKSYTRSIDFDALASTMQAVRIQNNAETPQTQIVPPNGDWAQKSDIWVTPYGFLKGAMANPVTLRSETLDEVKYNVVSFMLENKYKVEGFINEQNLVERVRTWIDNEVMGDMLVEGVYMDYKDFAGLKVPTLMILRQGGHPTRIFGVSDAKANVPVTLPPGAAPGGLTVITVESEKIADGVYYLKGGTHHSVLVEFADHVTLIEGPQNEVRTLALLAEVKKLYPNKPLTQVVNTHHHFDHSGGLRAFVDAGVTIVTHETNTAFYEKTFTAPRTLNPDRLEQSKKAATILPVADRFVMSDAVRTVELHHIKNNAHNTGMLMAFLPAEKILVEVDMYTPPAVGAPAPAADAPVNPNALVLLENLEKLRLDFETILPLHGPGKVSRADLYAFTKKPLVPVSSLPDPNAPKPAAAGQGGQAAAAPAVAPAVVDPAEAAMVQLVNTACSACHTLDRLNRKRGDRGAWESIVIRMRDRGAAVPMDQFGTLVEYLARVHPQ